jgi:hypothetical protein
MEVGASFATRVQDPNLEVGTRGESDSVMGYVPSGKQTSCGIVVTTCLQRPTT